MSGNVTVPTSQPRSATPPGVGQASRDSTIAIVASYLAGILGTYVLGKTGFPDLANAARSITESAVPALFGALLGLVTTGRKAISEKRHRGEA